MKSVRIIWTFFKKGLSEFTYFLSPFQLGLTLYTALILTLTGVRKQDIFLILIPIGVAGAFFMVALGKWQYTFKRSFYKKDAETEALNNPYIQAQNRLLVNIAKKTGIDTTDFEKSWIRKST